MLPGTMSNTLQKSKCINRVNFIKLLRMPTKIQHQDCLIRSCLETSVPWNYVSTSRSHMTLPNCNYQLLETSHSLTLEQWHFMSFSSQVFQAVFDKWNHFCDLTDRIWPHGPHRGSPWRDTAPTRVRVWPPSHQQLHLYVKPKLCMWWYILCIETKKKGKSNHFSWQPKAAPYFQELGSLLPIFYTLSKSKQPLSGPYLLHKKLLFPFVL